MLYKLKMDTDEKEDFNSTTTQKGSESSSAEVALLGAEVMSEDAEDELAERLDCNGSALRSVLGSVLGGSVSSAT